MATVKEEHGYKKNPAETFADLEKAVNLMGTIRKSDPEALSIEGKIKYGFGAKTKVIAEVRPEGNESIISFESKGGDVLGNAARSNVQHLLKTMNSADDPDFDVNKADKQQWRSVGYLVLALVGIAIYFLILFFKASWVADNSLIFGIVTAALIWGGFRLAKRKSK